MSDALKDIIADKALLTQERRPGLCGRDGRLQDWRFDLRFVILDPAGCALLIKKFIEHYGPGPYQLVSLEMASVPLVASIAALTRSNHLIVRKEAKPYGTFALVEGTPLKGVRTIFIDDLVNSGRHLIHAEAAVAPVGIVMKEIFTVIRIPNQNWDARVARLGYDHFYLYVAPEFDVVAQQPARVSWKEFRSVWINRPAYNTEVGSFPQSSPVVSDGLIFHGGRDCRFRCIAADSGKTVWEQPFTFHQKASLSTPAVRDGHVYMAAYDGNLRCFEAATGQQIWCQAAAEWIGSSPCLGSDRLFIGLEHARAPLDGGIAAFDLDTGNRLWEFGLNNWNHATPAYDAGANVVICGSNDGAIFGLDAATGQQLWRRPTAGNIKNKVLLDQGSAYLATDSGSVERVGVWRRQLPDFVLADMLMFAGKLWISCGDRHIYALDPLDGAVIHKTFANARVMSAPAAIEDHIFVGTNYGRVLELEPLNGAITGKHYLQDRIATRIAYNDGIFIAAVHDGTVVGFRRA